MIEVNKAYNSKELSEALGISYGQFRNKRADYEDHLYKFYNYTIERNKNNAIIYVIKEQINEFIPYKEFKKMQKNEALVSHIKATIHYDNRQTGSNIARIIIVDGEVQALNIKLSTLEIYVRDQLKILLEQGYYIKTDYQWCYLDRQSNKYILMDKEEVSRLREYFRTKDNDEEEENIWAQVKEGSIDFQEASTRAGELRYSAFVNGLKEYQQETGRWPMKVPVYERNAI